MLFIKKESSLQVKMAYIISRISEPFLLLTFLGAIIIFSHYFSGLNRFWWAVGLALIMGFLPLVTLWLGVKKIKNVDIDFTKRERRTPFISVILFYWLLGLILGWSLGAPRLVLSVLSVGVIVNLMVLIINFYWKVSNHTLVITAVSLFINQLFGWQYSWMFLFIPLVAWARLIQRKHTFWQLVGGIGLGIVAYFLLRAFGY
jgi:hypothetical protein